MTLSESPNNASMNFKTCRQLIHEDFRKVLTQQPHGKISEYLYILRYLITNNSFKFCFWFRLGSWSKGDKKLLLIYMFSWMMHRHYTFKFGIQMPLGSPVKGGLSFNHFSCIIINGSTQIGRNCTIFHGVTTALKMGGSNAGVPSIGDNCVLGPGSKILGSVTLGDNVFVGANDVVTHDIPSNSVVAGIPAKVINMNGIESTELIRLHK